MNVRPSFYIVPSKIVADHITTSHAGWLQGKKSDGTARKDSMMRKFEDPEDKYKEAWHLLEF